MKKFLLLLVVACAVPVGRAGPLDGLKQDLKAQAQDKAQEVKDDAPAAAQEQADQPADPPAAKPDAPAENPPASDAAPADAPPDAPAASDDPKLPALTVELRTTDPRGDNVTPSAPVTELADWVPLLFVTTSAHLAGDDSFSFTARMVVDDVPGLLRGFIVVPLPVETDGARLTLDSGPQTLSLAVPRALLPGRYRIEISSTDSPGRVAAFVGLTVRMPALGSGDFNLADPEMGGLVERVSEEDGAGLTWAANVLLASNQLPWTPVPRADAADDSEAPEMPCELVLSFFQRQPALVARVEITSANGENSPHEVEIWGSAQSATDGFTRLADATQDDGQAILTVPVPPTEVRFLKVRFVSKQNNVALAVTGIRVFEGQAAGYVPLLQRFPAIADWRIQPRHAAQQGLFYLSASAVTFQKEKDCMGCHVQSQALMGISIAAKSDYVFSRAAQKLLCNYALKSQNDEGDFARSPNHGEKEDYTNTVFAALGVAYTPETPGAGPQLVKAAQWLAAHQEQDGSIQVSDGRLPVTQGTILHTSNALDVWAEALKTSPDPAVRAALARGLAYIAQAEVQTTQDRVFTALAFLRHGDDDAKKQAHRICVELLQLQRADGGWPIEPDDTQPTSVFATGEVLYTLRTAGFSVGSPAFQRGVRFLIFQQKADGSWQESQEATPFSSTMWPVIALTGSFTTKIEPAHIAITALPRPLPPPPAPPVVAAPAAPTRVLPRNLELILDCSGSMNRDLGKSTRIATAKEVMRNVIARLPDGLQVGLRLYGHRYSSFSPRSNTDTELVVPIGPLDRAALVKVIDAAKAHGETPLVLSALQAGGDLKKIGGGAIVLVTDGEESCGGNPRQAGPQLAALGVPVRFDIIGFTLTGSRIAADMQAFAGATGGRFYTAADGVQLANALAAATAPTPRPPAPPPAPAENKTAPLEDFPYEIFNATGEKIATGSTLNLAAPDLEPGIYRVVLHDGANVVTLAGVKVDPAQTVDLRYSPANATLQVTQ